MSFEPVKIQLKNPIQHGNESISELVFGREMCSGDLRGDIQIGMPSYDHVRLVASRITGIPEPVLRTLCWSDFSQVVDLVLGFFNDTPLTGGKD